MSAATVTCCVLNRIMRVWGEMPPPEKRTNQTNTITLRRRVGGLLGVEPPFTPHPPVPQQVGLKIHSRTRLPAAATADNQCLFSLVHVHRPDENSRY